MCTLTRGGRFRPKAVMEICEFINGKKTSRCGKEKAETETRKKLHAEKGLQTRGV
jgi:hypothetical protein